MFVNVLKNIIILITVAITFSIGYFKPSHNFDMIGYVASAFYFEGLSGQELSESTYTDIKKEVSEQTFSTLTTGEEYRVVVYQDYRSLEQQLPFYSPRVLYIGFMKIFNDFGISYSKSSYLVSSIFAAASVLVVAFILKQLSVSIYLLPFIVVLSGLAGLAQYSTPDAMACFFSLCALSLLLSGRLSYLAIAALLPLVRTDYIILSLLLVVCALFSKQRLYALFSGVIALITYFLVNNIMGNYGWLTIFNFTLIEIDPYPEDIIISNHLMDYIKPYLRAAWGISNNLHGLIYLLAFTIWTYSTKKNYINISNRDLAVIVCLIFVVLHMLAFPVYMDRFFTFAAIFYLIFIFSQLKKLAKE
jgi:hypothetical protein